MTASSFAQAKDFKGALPYAKLAVEKMKKVEESWLALQLSIHYELKQNEEVAAVLKRLIAEFPDKKQYWLQLSQTYQTLEDTPKALAVLEVAYKKDLLEDEKDFVVLAKLQLQQGVPLKAAAILEKHMEAGQVEKKPETLELLATAWLMAEERAKAEAALEVAAGAASSGELYMQLAQFHVERHEWNKARDAITEALKQKLEDEGSAQLLLGIVNYNQKRMDAAITALNEAKKHEKTAKAAKEWISLVRNERGTDGGSASVDAAE
jgi:tetratricopeptide (TPR) repeat protein